MEAQKGLLAKTQEEYKNNWRKNNITAKIDAKEEYRQI